MKFTYKIQQYQTEAVESIVSVFRGQPYFGPVSYRRELGESFGAVNGQMHFYPTEELQLGIQGGVDGFGFQNGMLMLSEDALLQNIREVQRNNNLKVSERLAEGLGRCSLDIEMETGTGKTYVYIKAIYELNKRYGWTKFIIVVPSIAIREGARKSFEMTQDHFMEQYGKKVRFFVYSSNNLSQLDAFSSDFGINAMIINMQAFNASMKEGGRSKETKIIYGKRDEFASRRPIDVIKANRPILILDEPQKMGGNATQRALESFNPLFCLNFSATHATRHNLVFALDAVDAYNQRLVKKIEVKGIQVKNLRGTDHYMYLESILISPKHPPRARLEIEVAYQNSTNRETRICKVDDNLYEISKHMEQYKGYRISEIDPMAGTVSFTNGAVAVQGEVSGDASEQNIRRIQIRETILSHLEKEEELYQKGIKTLSLFFIDEVAKYRQYDEDGVEVLGEYGKMFEQEYHSIVNGLLEGFDAPYQNYLKGIEVRDTHKGYFSIDKKGHAVNSATKRGWEGSDDSSAYHLIMEHKERLLSFEEPTRFIFSHSALREGWDNPNVFQICTLKHSDSTTMKRQEVGRGLRLCVDKTGHRVDVQVVGEELVHKINRLTVVASESYQKFVADLQKQLKEALSDRPTQASIEYFTGKMVLMEGTPLKLGKAQAVLLYQYLVKSQYIDGEEHVTEQYRKDLENHMLAPLPKELEQMGNGIHKLIQSIFCEGILGEMIEDGGRAKLPKNMLNENFAKEEFQTLWDAVNHKYAYTVNFDSSELIQKSINHLDNELYVPKLMYTLSVSQQKETMDAAQVREGNSFCKEKSYTMELRHTGTGQIKYDLIGKIAEGTMLTRKTAAAILKGIQPQTFAMYRNNPEEFIKKAIRLINEQKAAVVVEHISYSQTDGRYESTIFTAEKHTSMNRAYRAKKHIQDYVFLDGNAENSVEKRFAESLDSADEVCVYAKLPKGFSIPTPVGNYTPDWAIAFHKGTVRHIFFVAETKGTMESLELRPVEKAKISCAKKLFHGISTEHIVYHEVSSYQDLLEVMDSPKLAEPIQHGQKI